MSENDEAIRPPTCHSEERSDEESKSNIFQVLRKEILRYAQNDNNLFLLYKNAIEVGFTSIALKLFIQFFINYLFKISFVSSTGSTFLPSL